MGFWYPDTEDKCGPWHWIGVAIGLCQAIGLHRKLSSQSSLAARERLWRQLWWTCYFREAWFAVGMGRPMRVNRLDCDVLMPTATDCDKLLEGVADNVRQKYFPTDTETLSHLWIDLLNLTITLSEIASANYRPEPTVLARAELERLDRRIRDCGQNRGDLELEDDPILVVHSCHLELLKK